MLQYTASSIAGGELLLAFRTTTRTHAFWDAYLVGLLKILDRSTFMGQVSMRLLIVLLSRAMVGLTQLQVR